MKEIHPHPSFLARVAAVSAVAAGALSLAGLAAWGCGQWRLVAFGAEYVPMAPSTAFLMLLLSTAAFLRARPSANRAARIVEVASLFLVLGGGALLGAQSLFDFALPVERWLSGTAETVGDIPVGRMSPLTAGCFVLVALGLWCGRVKGLRWEPLRSLGGWLGLMGLAVSGFIAAGYLAGKPFLYGGWTIPMALLTAVAFVLVSAAAILGTGHDAWPMSMFFRKREAAGAGPSHRIEWSFLSLFMLLLAGIAVVGLQYLDREQTEARLAAHTQLETIANLKVQQIGQWRKERLADANLVRFTPYAARRALDALAQPDSTRTRQMFTGWLNPLLTGGSYERALLLDAELNVRLVHPPSTNHALADAVRRPAEQALRTQTVVMTDLHQSPGDEHVHLDLLIPLVVRREGANDAVPAAGLETSPADRSAGLLVLQVNAHDFLFPLIQSWPTASPTAETLLVRQEGDEVLFLNELRHRAGATLTLRRPLNDPQLPAAMGLRGDQNAREGVDYRGVTVVATARTVPDTGWVMVAKVDQAELYAPLRQKALAVVGLALALLLVAALGVTVLWRRQNEHFLRAQLATERDRRVLAERFEHLMKSANDAILLADEQDRILEANDRMLELSGYAAAELRAMTLPQLRPPELLSDFTRRAENLSTTGQAAFETRHRRKDGTTYPVEISSRLVEIGGVRYKLGIIRDITQRKAHEAEIERLNRLYATLSQVNQTIVRCQTREELFAEICRVVVEFGQFKAAWIGWKVADGDVLTAVAHQASGPDSNLTMPGWTRGCGVMAETLRTGQAYLCNDSNTDERAACCREKLAGMGVQSCAAFPLHFRGEVCGAFSICSIEPSFFNAAEIGLLEEVSADISFALDKLDKEAQRQRAEQALAALSSRQEAILAAVPDIIMEVNAHKVYTWANQAGRAFFGDDVLGQKADCFFEGEQTTYETVRPLFDGCQDVIYVESWQRRQDGQKRLLAWWCRVLKDEHGNVTGALSSARDITEQRQAEAALRESEAQFKCFFEHANVGKSITRPSGEVQVNQAFCDLLGYSPAELQHRIWQAITHPEDVAPTQRVVEALLAGKQDAARFTKRYLHQNGSVVWADVSTTLRRDETGQPLYFMTTVMDITARQRAEESLRESEERLRLATDAARMGTWERDLKTNRLTWSPMAEQLNGYDPGTFPGTEEALRGLLHPDSHAEYAAARHRVRHGDGIYQAELHFRLRDGRERWGFVYGRLIRDSSGQPDRIVGIDMDITERKRLEQERQSMEAQLRQQQKLESIGTLAAGVAHEINNPINGAMNYAQLIQDRLPPDSPLAEFTGEILRETQRIATIVRNLLQFSRQEKQTHSPARLADIIEGTLSLIRTVIRHDQITLNVTVPEDLPDLKCRSQQIQQVLMNLMTNARDALNERYPGHDPDKVLNLLARQFEQEGRRWIRVTVEDHGTGITPEVRQRMFDPFFTTKPRDKGTGLGLAISHGIVKEHHGALTVESEPGKFTRMHLVLPVDNGWSV